MKVGDEGKDRLVPNLHKLLTVTCSKEQSNHDDIINYRLFGISHLPDKSGIYAAYLALLNLNSHSLSVEICTQAAKLLEHAVTNSAEHEAAQVVFCHTAIRIEIQVLEKLVEVFLKLGLADLLQEVYHPCAVRWVDQTVIIDPLHLR